MPDWFRFLQSAYPEGLYFKDLTASSLEAVDWSALATVEDPLVFRVHKKQLKEIVESLIQQGLSPSTSCALLQGDVHSGSLGDIVLRSRKLPQERFYFLIAEDISKVHSTRRPLEGKRVLVTRAGKQAGDLTRLLQQRGAIVFEVPTIEIVLRPEKCMELKNALQNIREYSWLVLTSVNTVSILNDLLREMTLQWNLLDSLSIACIGTATAARVREYGGNVALLPPRFQAESMAEELLKQGVSGKKILLPRAEGSRNILPKRLTDGGATVHEIHIYRAELPETSRQELTRVLEKEQIDFITFTSSSTVRNFVELAAEQLSGIDLRNCRIACIGPITAATLEEYGLPVAVQAAEFTMEGLIDAIVEFQNRL